MNNKHRVNHKVHLSYRDVLLVPYDKHFCQIKSRNDPNISSEVCYGRQINIPLISAPMDSITGSKMAIALNECGAMGVITRHIGAEDEIEKHIQEVSKVRKAKDQSKKGFVSCAIGVRYNPYEHAKQLCDVGLEILCLDIANGNHIFIKEALEAVAPLKDKYGLSIIAGNVAAPEAAKRLADFGADTIKIGIGPGAVCTTRRVTGFGVPQLTSILDCAEALDSHHYAHVRIIADGGLRHPGDATKAIWAGANTVMAGYIFAGHDESEENKTYKGMSSRTVSGRSDVAAEGIHIQVKGKGKVENTVNEWAAALRASCSMANANNLQELRENVHAIRVSTMSNEESDPVRGE